MIQETSRPAVLVSLLSGKKEDLDLVRRKIGYKRLVLITQGDTHGLAQTIQESEGDDVVAVHHFPQADALDHLGRLRMILDAERRSTRREPRIVLNAAGGDPDLVLALILLAYEEGHETWFTQEGRHERFPILAGVKIQNRLEDTEGQVLRALPEDGSTSSDIAQRIVRPRPRVETALRELEKKDLVVLFAHQGRLAARPTETGRYLKQHLEG